MGLEVVTWRSEKRIRPRAELVQLAWKGMPAQVKKKGTRIKRTARTTNSNDNFFMQA